MGPLIPFILGSILGSIFLVVCAVLLIRSRRTGDWRALKFAIGTGVLLFLVGAIGIGSEVVFFLRLTRAQPQTEALVGTWKQNEYKSYPSQITLLSDGTFTSSGPDSLTGLWQLSQDGEFWSITFRSQSWMKLDLVGRSAPYRLYAYVGDPDSNEMVIYTKLIDNDAG